MLNQRRSIDSTTPEDLQDIGIPERDFDTLGGYWQVLPSIREELFEPFDRIGDRPGCVRLKLPITEVDSAIQSHAEFAAFQYNPAQHFDEWRTFATQRLIAFGKGDQPKALIETIAEEPQNAFRPTPLLDVGDIYQQLMHCWSETLQDDANQTHGQVGRQIAHFEHARAVRAEYGKALDSTVVSDLGLRHGKGVSRSNLIYMRVLYLRFPISQEPPHPLSWSHNAQLLKLGATPLQVLLGDFGMLAPRVDASRKQIGPNP